jgi:hypothetical protein
MADGTRRLSRNPSFEHGLVDAVAFRAPADVNPSARGNAKANQHGWVNAFARQPRARQCRPKVDVARRLTLDPVDERRAMVVDEMRQGATAEGWEVGLRKRANEMTREIERLRRSQRADDLAKPFPGQVGIACRPAEVMRVRFGEANECNG